MELDINAYRRLIAIGSALSEEKDIHDLLAQILREAKLMAGAAAGCLYLRTELGTLEAVVAASETLHDTLNSFKGDNEEAFPELFLHHRDGSPNLENAASRSVHQAKTIYVDGMSSLEGTIPVAGARSALTVPLTSQSERPMGVLQLLSAKNSDAQDVGFPQELVPFIESLASLATMALQNRRLLDQQVVLKTQLETQVDERTEELRLTLEKLSEANVILKDLNTIDAVTRIKNRRYFDDIAVQEWRRAVRQQYPMTLMLLDIDNFKWVNDNLGHLAGDACLHSVAESIDELFNRPSDVVARYGGDEFIVIMPYIRHDNAMIYAERVRDAVSKRELVVDGQIVKVTISIGVASGMPDASITDIRQLIARSDEALYEAKADGRNRVAGIDINTSLKLGS
ncbi:MAG: GGDEF domain-containing protein [SAR86 cluster bacterium]|uniref:diguanylate cyclase n=1 Tax=SAR86 cluster bacterium TaxID=2030880 RepID=A0A972VZ81_9GAMM|nr:GGDEF domain-containing protein [SAR86 cluster bacterium]